MSASSPACAVDVALLRAEALGRIRAFFAERGVTEVQTPLITSSGVTDVHIESLRLDDGRFLRTSPEFAHKRLLARGVGDLFELGPVFRAGERGRSHRPEFVLLEWYRLGWTWSDLAAEAIDLVRRVMPERDWRVETLPWCEAIRRAVAVDVDPADPDSIRAATVEAPAGLEPAERLDWLFALRVQPSLDPGTLTVVHDYPACQAALARLKPGEPQWAERFELFAGTLELGNGYRELTDPEEQRRRFEHDNRVRERLARPLMPVDEDLLEALAAGLPECSGIAMGFERLLMAAHPGAPIDAFVLD